MAQQGSLELLNDPVAKALLGSVNPAKLAYTWMDGTPRVVPIWFHWTGEQFILTSPTKAPKLRALAADPRVTLAGSAVNPPLQVADRPPAQAGRLGQLFLSQPGLGP
jgi:Pyridoxamine 5'-phosphate oxidase